ncbi:DNA ligase (ATP) DNL4 [Cyberlindnera jadinii NRRL Y-1542]|uniref:DNA ligase n=1 Tax=Cyberlindnera jadinii (strain ATCC 18201 / CBS 1600 / BCRC 20928 / JCM 3617 / NBRC 0987 / NRRL Y-1542) TaxID=983966 RepID=A0A1E4RUU7_CYBJN|nr:ATP-dependent DNA ligase [Cyberlindnera jadinii NRRL Y-1542]ODV71042.1 ATP-dependent DNA ligase [Cyberlindnera jadinii NRRL Y-1542]
MMDQEPSPENFGGPLPSFKWLCEELFVKLDRIHAENNKLTVTEQKRKVVEVFIQHWRGTVGPQFFPALRLIMPNKDRERLYNIKDYYLGKRVLELLKIPKSSSTTERVINWKRGTGERMSKICVEVLRERRPDVKGGGISIEELNRILDRLSSLDCKKQEQMTILRHCLDNMCFVEVRYFLDILLKKNIVRNMENTVLYMWHPDAVNYLKVVSDLRHLCDKLYDPGKRLSQAELSINLGFPFSPQLAKKPNISYANLVQSFQSNFVIEEKLDGERIQMHYINYGEEIRYWSRRGTDYTYLYGDSLTSGCISPHLRFLENVQSAVLDGEMVTYDPERNAILPFGALKSSAVQELQRIHGNITECDRLTARPLFIVFDILHLNGSSLVYKTLEHRKEFLNAVLRPTETFVEIINSVRATDESMIVKALETTISKGLEGIMVKQLQSKYYMDKRSDFWVKIKPEYLEQFGENVDLVVIGREKSKKDIYYCGLKVDDSPLFWCFCRVANGFDQDDYRKIEELTGGKWKSTETCMPPIDLIEFGKKIPPEWIDPRESFVIEVKARSVDRSLSRNYKVETTLYNAYSRRIRDDKDWKTATTLDEYKEIKLSSRDVGDDLHKLNVQRKRLQRKRKLENRDEEVWNLTLSSRQSSLFDGLTFMVISDGFYEGCKYFTTDIESVIRKNGGTITKNQALVEDVSLLRIIGNKKTLQAIYLREEGYDVFKVNWIFDSIRERQLCKVLPKHCLLVSSKLKEVAAQRVDSLGIGFTAMVTPGSLRRVLQEELQIDGPVLRGIELVQLFGGLKPYVYANDAYEQKMMELQLQRFGARVTSDLETCNIVIVSSDEACESQVKQMRGQLSSLAKYRDSKVETVRIVTMPWISKSIEEGVQADPRDFQAITNRDI